MKKLYVRPVIATREGKEDRWWAIQQKEADGKFHTLSNGIYSHAYPRREQAERVRAHLQQQAIFSAPDAITNHRCFAVDDYEYLSKKGYTDDEIVKIWNEDVRKRILADLLWLESYQSSEVMALLKEYRRLKNNNPYSSHHENHA